MLALTLAGSLLECALPAPTYTVQELGDAGEYVRTHCTNLSMVMVASKLKQLAR